MAMAGCKSPARRKVRYLHKFSNQHFHSAVCSMWITWRAMFERLPYRRPVGLVRLEGERVALRLVGDDGSRMATHLRPMTLRDAFAPPRFSRRRPR